MAEDNLFHDILIIGTSSWDYEDNFDPISRKKILISRKNLHFLCLLYFLRQICVYTFCVHFIVVQRFTVSWLGNTKGEQKVGQRPTFQRAYIVMLPGT